MVRVCEAALNAIGLGICILAICALRRRVWRAAVLARFDAILYSLGWWDWLYCFIRCYIWEYSIVTSDIGDKWWRAFEEAINAMKARRRNEVKK